MIDADATEGPIRVLIVDDHDLFRQGLRALLTEQGFDVVGESATGEGALVLAATYEPEVVMMDLSMPGMGGIEATRRLAERTPGSRVVVLTIAAGERDVEDAIAAGAAGYLLKEATPEEIGAGIRAAAAGHAPVSPRVTHGLIERVRDRAGARGIRQAASQLTERELEVLRLMSGGLSNREIAEELHVTAATVKNHVASILAKLPVENRVQAAVYAARAGLV
jgi:DNA-binding NarL/FixJ family response regulator